MRVFLAVSPYVSTGLSPVVFRGTCALLLAFWLSGCAGVSELERPPGEQRCEAFFIYVLCVNDYDRDGLVDFMYFDDTRDIFMYQAGMRDELASVMPLHPCAIPMSNSTREYSSQLLYGDDLGITRRLSLKGKLITNYRAAQPAVDACYDTLQQSQGTATVTDDSFFPEDDWDEGPP